jgi:hypothetical protein
MIIKYFSSGSSSSGAVEYIEKNETAKVLKGNPNLTRDLIKNNTNKLKYRSGVISFGSDRPTKEQVIEIIELFEKSTFAGLNKDQYNILWVEHTNTENYHIHFVIPRLELSTMKSFNPHYYKQDQKRLMKLQDYINRKYYLINPFTTERRQTNLSADIRDNMKDKEFKEMIYKYIDTAFTDGIIENRNDIIKILQDSNFVVKESKNFLGIKKKNGKHIRLKGVFYNENFRSREEIETDLKREEREHRADTYGELIKVREELDKLIEYKSKRVNKQYKSETRETSEGNREQFKKTSSKDRQTGNTEDTTYDLADMDSDNLASFNYTFYTTANDRTTNERMGNDYDTSRTRDRRLLGEDTDDSIRATTSRSFRGNTEEERELIQNSSTVRERIYEQYSRDSRKLQADNEAATADIHKRIESYNTRIWEIQSRSVERVRVTSRRKLSITAAVRTVTTNIKEFTKRVIEKLRPQRQQRQSRSFTMSR